MFCVCVGIFCSVLFLIVSLFAQNSWILNTLFYLTVRILPFWSLTELFHLVIYCSELQIGYFHLVSHLPHAYNSCF